MGQFMCIGQDAVLERDDLLVASVMIRDLNKFKITINIPTKHSNYNTFVNCCEKLNMSLYLMS